MSNYNALFTEYYWHMSAEMYLLQSATETFPAVPVTAPRSRPYVDVII